MTVGYLLVLTEDGYTTADGPMTREQALAEFSQFAPGLSPHSGSRLRVVAEDGNMSTRGKTYDEVRAQV